MKNNRMKIICHLRMCKPIQILFAVVLSKLHQAPHIQSNYPQIAHQWADYWINAAFIADKMYKKTLIFYNTTATFA